ncbi:MAG TPA: IS4 family transposase [Cyanobacteria bacterium UBA11149]|nr:IS4 family transposase [Cyanobacteria bacterium UBA11367]HBE57432.1 IS4 family transposase [Cyanobacteria bacterium UBA11366]HBK62836.1 IS4 family transposase [Cyanobacteria bacterium UBA11166]HBR73089.1 IS4 family transposase [Cyanobacteria bacterium UBA11159]HBS72673.1 IS4 family transposase [Cyanobacteria bacterium UBA11153]HBW88736.1 IS4 family transposase [Cyanobacteria bacterium UBA11149]HCA95172.1 IS4 family transposase [Cyanobacteria bacterium UBA9226]
MLAQWVKLELEKTDLGDSRRTKRFMKIVSNLSNRPGSSVPLASGTWAETKATYDFWDSPYIKPAQLRQGHVDATRERIKNHQVILAIQDTTELNYTTHKAVKGVGYLDSKYAQGLKVHSTLAATIEGVPLGIIDQYVWARDSKELGKSAQRSQKLTEEKESQRWLDALKNTLSIMPNSREVVTIADREADFYDLFALAKSQGAYFLIRATQNRCLESSDNHLKEEMELVEPQVTVTVELKRNPTRPSREATLTIRAQTLTIQPPKNRGKKEELTPMSLGVILVRELQPPSVEEAIEWWLVTNLPVTEISDVTRYVKWYSYRWLIERYHYVLKSGCGLEKLQLETAQRLEMALATYSLVAWRLLYLTYQARIAPDSSCELILSPTEWQALYGTIYHKIYPNSHPPTFREAVAWIAKLGGFLGRKHDGLPGVKALWRGLRRLDDITTGWLLFQELLTT